MPISLAFRWSGSCTAGPPQGATARLLPQRIVWIPETPGDTPVDQERTSGSTRLLQTLDGGNHRHNGAGRSVGRCGGSGPADWALRAVGRRLLRLVESVRSDQRDRILPRPGPITRWTADRMHASRGQRREAATRVDRQGPYQRRSGARLDTSRRRADDRLLSIRGRLLRLCDWGPPRPDDHPLG